MHKCNICHGETVKKSLDLGRQPVCHRFLSDTRTDEYVFPMELGQCQKCATVQLLNHMPMEAMRPRFDWLECNEPEPHLDELVARLTKLPGINNSSNIWGVSFKEESTLARFEKLGCTQTHRLALKKDLDIDDPLSGVETVVNSLTQKQAEAIVTNRGKADIVIARHLIEHAFDVRDFLAALKTLLKPNGYIVLEIPDCQRAFENFDYTNYWEEHTVYFTEQTFRNVFKFAGLKLRHFEIVEYPLENSCIGVAQVCADLDDPFSKNDVSNEELIRFEQYAAEFSNKKKETQKYLTNFIANQGKIAMFGAGHMSCVYLNLMDIADYVEFVVDDNAHKNGMFMPGSKLPILPSAALLEKDIKLCLLTLSQASEEKVLAKNQDFLEQGGIFKSVFSGNERSLVSG